MVLRHLNATNPLCELLYPPARAVAPADSKPGWLAVGTVQAKQWEGDGVCLCEHVSQLRASHTVMKGTQQAVTPYASRPLYGQNADSRHLKGSVRPHPQALQHLTLCHQKRPAIPGVLKALWVPHEKGVSPQSSYT